MNFAFCTIITSEYIPFACALRHSLAEQLGTSFAFFVFIAESKHKIKNYQIPEELNILSFEDVCTEGLGKDIYDKYQGDDVDKFRWSMKPVVMRHILTKLGFRKVLYSDSDIHFFANPSFLIDFLEKYSILLSPHFRSSDSVADRENFILHFKEGIYNGGFVGASSSGIDALTWWAKTCLAICEKDSKNGLFDDQSHLNLLPVFFENVNILAHRGCNVANWNRLECKRCKQEDGTVLINNTFPIIFIHFTRSTIRGILISNDRFLLPYLHQYRECLQKHGHHLSLNPAYFQQKRKKQNQKKTGVLELLKNWRDKLIG